MAQDSRLPCFSPAPARDLTLEALSAHTMDLAVMAPDHSVAADVRQHGKGSKNSGAATCAAHNTLTRPDNRLRGSTDVCLTRRTPVIGLTPELCGHTALTCADWRPRDLPSRDNHSPFAPVRRPHSAQPSREPTHLRGPAARTDAALRRRCPATAATFSSSRTGPRRFSSHRGA